MKKQSWGDLTSKEQEGWHKKADAINKAGLASFTRYVGHLLEDGILKCKDGKIVASGTYAFKMKQEKGIPPEIWLDTLKQTLEDFRDLGNQETRNKENEQTGTDNK